MRTPGKRFPATGAVENTIIKGAFLNHVFNITANDVTLSGFSIYGGTGGGSYGIYMGGRSGCTIKNNRSGWDADHYNGGGIFMTSSSSNVITNNTCSNSQGNGIYMYSSSSNNIISHNTCQNNPGNGIQLSTDCEGNTIVGNTLTSNNMGIRHAVNNIIYLNDLSANTADSIYGGTPSTLSSPSKVCYFHNSSHQEYLGNYYGDEYSGVDDGSGGRVAGDGIGDTNLPHNPSSGDVGDDYYPLMEAPGNYEAQAWYLSGSGSPNETMDKADMGNAPGTVSLAASGSNIWVSDQAAETDVNFSSGNWTGQVTFSNTPDEADDFTVEIGYYTTSFQSAPSPLTASINCDGSNKAFAFTTNSAGLTVPNTRTLALKITADSGNDGTADNVTTGGAWSYTSNPDTGAPNYPIPELPTIILVGGGLAGLAGYLFLKRRKKSYSRA